jgi:glycosyltransferase involved in cell wall biosynthesis
MWYKEALTYYERPWADVRTEDIDSTRTRLARLQAAEPLVTVSVIAYNEERHLMACLQALSRQACRYPMEIIGVDNDSKDATAQVFQALGIPCFTETRHSCGWARSCGLRHARGRYHINIDADTLYPPRYVETMVEALEREGVTGVCSSWSYIPNAQNPAWLLRLYEAGRDAFLWLQHFKRPELSVRGLVFAYPTELARQIGIRTDIVRGEDGSLALRLKEHGRIAFLHKRRARAVTGYGTLSADGSLMRSLAYRARLALSRIGQLFHAQRTYEDDPSNLVNHKE